MLLGPSYSTLMSPCGSDSFFLDFLDFLGLGDVFSTSVPKVSHWSKGDTFTGSTANADSAAENRKGFVSSAILGLASTP